MKDVLLLKTFCVKLKSHKFLFSCYLADSFRLGDLGSVLVGHQGVEDEKQPLQLLGCQLRLFSFALHNS